jgi:uncharacterized membrane protein
MSAILALLSSGLWGTADFFGGLLSRRIRPFAVVGVAHTFALAAVVVLAVLVGAVGDDRDYLPWALAAGVVGMLALVAFYWALAIGTMGVVAPIAATGVVVPVGIGLVQGERPSIWQLLGIAIAIVGVVLASGPEVRAVEHHEARGGWPALILASIAAAGFGLVLWLVAEGAESSVTMTLLTQRATSVTIVVVVAVITRSAGGMRRQDLPMVAFVGFADVAANGLYAVASQQGLLSVVSVLGSLYPVATVALARTVLGERLTRAQDLGVAAALFGVVLIAAG